jgi:hypothetical protein
MDGYLSKPLDLELLRRCLARHLSSGYRAETPRDRPVTGGSEPGTDLATFEARKA